MAISPPEHSNDVDRLYEDLDFLKYYGRKSESAPAEPKDELASSKSAIDAAMRAAGGG